jgi:DNA invertase Pin-like site-specific DNA recombinase
MTTSVAIYTRLSSDTPGRQQTATKRQEQACRAFASLREWDVAQVYEDVDLSAYKKGVKRPAYESLLKAIEAHRVSGVVVWKLDRLVRRPAEFERFWASCEEVGAILVSATEPIDTSTDLGVALVRILVSFAGLNRPRWDFAYERRRRNKRGLGSRLAKSDSASPVEAVCASWRERPGSSEREPNECWKEQVLTPLLRTGTGEA